MNADPRWKSSSTMPESGGPGRASIPPQLAHGDPLRCEALDGGYFCSPCVEELRRHYRKPEPGEAVNALDV